MAKRKPKRAKSTEQLQEEEPFIGYDGGAPVIVLPWNGELPLEKLIMEAAFEAARLSDETYFNIAMDRVESAIRCAQHVLDHRGVLNGKA